MWAFNVCSGGDTKQVDCPTPAVWGQWNMSGQEGLCVVSGGLPQQEGPAQHVHVR